MIFTGSTAFEKPSIMISFIVSAVMLPRMGFFTLVTGESRMALTSLSSNARSQSSSNTVLKHEVAAITKRLRARNAAAHKMQPAGMPSEIFTGNYGIVDRYILSAPECIL